MQVSQLFIYPIKSLGGIEVASAKLLRRGFEHDRRWMLVTMDNQFMTQREWPAMALLRTGIEADRLVIRNIRDKEQISFPIILSAGNKIRVTVWNDECDALEAGNDINDWFSKQLQVRCKLVYMHDESLRMVEKPYAQNNEITSFSDAYPVLIIGQASLDDLNRRLEEPLPINRFRPNIVFTGGRPYQEDEMEEFTINSLPFSGVKLCARCAITTIDQDRAIKNKEPLKTLATYRSRDNKIYFGQNLLHSETGTIRVNDQIHVIKEKPAQFPLPQ